MGLVVNSEKTSCKELVRSAAALARRHACVAMTDLATARLAGLDLPTHPDTATLSRRVDLLMVFGGDGTMLRVARETAGSSTPIVGINAGGLGFLTNIQAHQLPLAWKHLHAGTCRLETRPLIEANGRVNDRRISLLALNDFVVTRGAAPRLIELEVRVDGDVLTRYRCDGLIVCTPTGSTAYSLAAGGAVVSPSSEVFTLTPICPHTLSNRSVIVNQRSLVQVRVISRKVDTILTADGQTTIPLASGDEISIRKSRYSVRLLHLAGRSFFDTLRRKLNWSGSNVRRARR